MIDDLIQQAAQLMREQAHGYRQLDSATRQLIVALTNGTPALIESLTRANESELLRMRARLVGIVSLLTTFADRRAQASQSTPLNADVRLAFESASNELMEAARTFERVRQRAAALAYSGSTFYTACIETCGVQPMTYRAPYTRRGEAPTWA